MKNKKTRKIKRGKKIKFSKRKSSKRNKQRGGNQEIITNIDNPTSNDIYNNCISVFSDYKIIEISYIRYDSYDSYDIRIREDSLCMILSINIEKMYVSNLYKCSKTGTFNLKKIKEFASMCGVKRIDLVDGSSFFLCNRTPSISLALFEILRTGMSWYNRMGFVSDNFSKEQHHNNIIRNENLSYMLTFFLTQCARQFRKRCAFS